MSSLAATDADGCEARGVFYCPEESGFYAQCLKSLIFMRDTTARTVVEFGSGDGSPVIEALRESYFQGLVQGFELNPVACEIANSSINVSGLRNRYRVYNESFFTQRPEADCLIANPPYLPAPDNDIRMPLLYGGEDGSSLTNTLLSLGYERTLLMISSYSNPIGTLRHAAAQGYAVHDFIIAPLTFGIYSSEPKVKRRIEALYKAGKAFYKGDIYLLIGVLFKKRGRIVSAPGRATELTNILIAL